MASKRSAFALFCDDVRMEVGNKPSFMGIYTGDLILPVENITLPPIALPKLCVIVWVFADVSDPVKHVTVRITAPPRGSEIAKLEASIPTVDVAAFTLEGITRLNINIPITISPFTVQGAGIIEVAVEADGERLEAGRLKIRVPGWEGASQPTLPSPTVSEPSSKQSLSVPERPRTRRRQSARTPE